MDAATLASVFEPFAQAEQALARTKGGLGIGLALAKGLVELHGGSVWAHSDGLGRGSTFTIRLPIRETADVASAAAPTDAPPVRRRVLLIEDNPDAADTLRELLTLEGHEVAVAYDGLTGVAQVEKLRPDLVVCDIGLPGMDGLVVARAIRADPRLRRTSLVALSGYARPEDLCRATAAGFDLHLAKPVHLGKLRGLMAELA